MNTAWHGIEYEDAYIHCLAGLIFERLRAIGLTGNASFAGSAL